MSGHARSLIFLSLVAALSGCTQSTIAYVPLGSHTLRVAPDREADVVWLVRADNPGTANARETVMRCHNSDQGPVCLAAKVP
jgi:hypothetical protein